MAVPAHNGKRPPFALASYGAAGNSWSQEDPPSLKLRRGTQFMPETDTSCWNGRSSTRVFCSVLSTQHSLLIYWRL